MRRLWLGNSSIKIFKNGNGTLFFWNKLTTLDANPTWSLIGCWKHIWTWCVLDTYPLGWRIGWNYGWWCTWMNSCLSLSLSSTLFKKNCRRIDSYVEFLRPELTIASQVRRISSTNSRNRFALVFFFSCSLHLQKFCEECLLDDSVCFGEEFLFREEHLCVCVFFKQFSKVREYFWRPCWKNWNMRSLFFFFFNHLLMCRMFICVGIFRACLELSIGDQFFLGRETNFRWKFEYIEECMCWIGGLGVELSTEERELFLLESS